MTDSVLSAPLSRRLFLKTGALVGCSIAAQPLMTTVTFAAAPGENRLVVLILRGAMDGLDVVRPVGDPAFAGYRNLTLKAGEALPLTGIYAAHPDLAPLMPLWAKGELAFAHALSTPYRDKRSHFDGQDILEAGTGRDVPDLTVKDGWLNRMLQAMPGLSSETAFAVGRDEMKVILGRAPYASWAPDARLQLSAQGRRLLARMYQDDPMFRTSATEAIALTDQMAATADAMGAGSDGMMMASAPAMAPAANTAAAPDPLAAFAASRLKGDTRIATFSISGWDSHAAQADVLKRELGALCRTILTLKEDLGPVWGKTTVIAMTEFGRTAKENGTGGTDHGTGGAMLMAGGAIRGGKVYGRWPGLDEAALYERRDLMPTADVRAYAAWAMRGLYGLDKGLLEKTVFPGLDMGTDPGILA